MKRLDETKWFETLHETRDVLGRDRDKIRDPQVRDRDETETLGTLVETRPRRDVGTSRDRLETETSTTSLQICYKCEKMHVRTPFGFRSRNAYTGSHKIHFLTSLKYHRWICRHPKPPKQYKNHQILLNIGVVMAKVSYGPPPMQKDPPQGGPGVQKFGPSIFTHYDLKPTGIWNKINFRLVLH